jgi:hypothetical protein
VVLDVAGHGDSVAPGIHEGAGRRDQ